MSEPTNARRERRRTRTRAARPWWTSLVYASTFSVESLLVTLVHAQPSAIGTALTAHLLVVSLLVVQGRGTPRSPSRPALYHLALWTAVTGPLGPCIVLPACLVARRGDAEVLSELADRFAAPPRPDADIRVERLCLSLREGRIEPRPTAPVLPLLDCVRFGERDAKLDALRIVASHYAADFAPVLRTALMSRDAAVKVMAATVLSTLKKRLADELASRRTLLGAEPRKLERRLDLAESLVGYARSGLLDADPARKQLAKARRALASGMADGIYLDARYHRLKGLIEETGRRLPTAARDDDSRLGTVADAATRGRRKGSSRRAVPAPIA